MPELRRGENRCPADRKLLFIVKPNGIEIICHKKKILFVNTTLWTSLNGITSTEQIEFNN